MRSRLCAVGLILALISASAIVAALYGCKPKEQLDVHFRPRYENATFKDMRGDPLEETLAAFVRLGVFDFSGGEAFLPKATLERGTFLTWLVRAWNIYYRDQPKRWVRLAEVKPNAPCQFGDAMAHTPLYPYLQGMVEAGRLVGPEQGEWQYSRRITRQELILLRNSVVLGGGRNGREKVWAPEEERDDYRIRLRSYLSDADETREEYLAAVANDIAEGESIKLAFTDVNLADREHKPALKPLDLVTRREAVQALSKLGERNFRNAGVAALGEWKPLSKEEAKALDKADEVKRKGAVPPEHEH
ncbi:MAG: hypothetical protein FJX75_01335 [Armatimonadetes bacterium]|nr:hypothetical protein [Armatimonadota bacterium]